MKSPYHCAYIGRKSRKNYAHNHHEIMGAYGQLVVHHEPINSVFSAALGDFGYLARSADLAELLALGRIIQATD